MTVDVGYYSLKEIKAARNLLYDNFSIEHRPPALRKKQRQRDNKADNVVKGIQEVLQFKSVTKKFTLLTFSTSSGKFPPMDVNHLDALAMSQDIDKLKKEVAKLKSILKSCVDIKSLQGNTKQISGQIKLTSDTVTGNNDFSASTAILAVQTKEVACANILTSCNASVDKLTHAAHAAKEKP